MSARAATGTSMRTMRFSAEVERALAEVLPSDDPLDSPDFDPVEFINARFTTERSLDGLDAFIAETRQKLRASEGRLLDAVKVQATTASKAANDLQSAKDAVVELHHRVSDIKVKAEASETMVSSICDSIRHLDTAKANLSKSIRTLRDLQLYIRNVQNLSAATDAKDWAAVNSTLRKAQDHRSKFRSFEETPKVRELADKLGQHEKQLEFYLCANVIVELQSGITAKTEESLRDACLVVDALGEEVVKRFRQKYIQAVMEPYAAMFRRGTEDANFERTERRFVYIKTKLDQNNALFLKVFPRHWCVCQELCVEFCLRTNREIATQLREEAGGLEIAALVYILQRTIEFEKDLTSRIRSLTIDIDEEQCASSFAGASSGMDAQQATQQLPEYKYYGMIVRCFDPHMDQYVQHEDQMLERTVSQSFASDSVVEDLLVLQSSQDVFLFIQESSARSSRFANPMVMADLARVWLKHLQNYAALLINAVASIPNSTDKLEHYCVVINTADYSRGAAEGVCQDLTKFAESEIDSLRPMIDATTEAFVKLSSTANHQVVEGYCLRLQGVVAELQTYLSVNFNASGQSDSAHLDSSALDESNSSKKLRREYTDLVRLAARMLHPQCFPYLLNKFAATFIPKVWAMALYKPKARHSDLAISQLHIDCKALEGTLLAVPNEVITAAARPNAPGGANGGAISRASVLGATKPTAGSNAGDAPRVVLNAYQRTVRREVNFLSMALKVLQLPAGDGFVQLYHQITPPEKRSLTDCAKLLELKGVKPDDTRQLIALLKRRADVPMSTQRDALLDPAGSSGQPKTGGVLAMFGGGGRDDDSRVASSPVGGGAGGNREGSKGGGGFFNVVRRAQDNEKPAAATDKPAKDDDDDGPAGAWKKIKAFAATRGGSKPAH